MPRKTKPTRRKKRAWWQEYRLVYWGLVASLWAGIGLATLIFFYALGLPDTRDLWKISRTPEIGIYAHNDTLIARRGRRTGRPLRYDDLPPDLIHAVIAIEDRRFFDHYGLDWRGLGRAFVANLRAGRIVQGGSTLTQQLAKNVFLTPERSFKRKVQELLLAFWLEATLTKRDILALYLNRVYFGAGAYGVQAAAETYFARPAQELTLGEAALLAGLLKAPSRYAPTRDPEAAHARAELVLAAMREMGRVTPEQADAAANNPVAIVTRSGDTAHYAVDWMLGQLPDFIGRPRSDLDVITTIDPVMQIAAERAVKAGLDTEGRARDAGQAALVVMTPDGAVRAMVGGRSYVDSQFNRAVLARRQPGSAFKPIVYLAGLEAGLKTHETFTDAPFSVGRWTPRNYDDDYRGEVSVKTALAQSLNTVAVQVSEQTGRERVIATARRLGVTAKLAPHPSIALGTFEMTLLELTGAYAHFANGGRLVIPHIVRTVITASGDVLYERRATPLRQVIDAGDVGRLNDMLVAAVRQGTGRAARVDNLVIAGKTGTSQNWRDAWFVGYTGALVVGVWVGNDDGHPMSRVTGGGLPARIWGDFMTRQASTQARTRLPGLDAVGRVRRGIFDRLFD